MRSRRFRPSQSECDFENSSNSNEEDDIISGNQLIGTKNGEIKALFGPSEDIANVEEERILPI